MKTTMAQIITIICIAFIPLSKASCVDEATSAPLADDSVKQKVSVKAFQTARDAYISELISRLDGDQLAAILSTEGNNPKIKKGVYIQSLPKFAANDITNTDLKDALHQAAVNLDNVATKFHRINSTKPLMTLQLVNSNSNCHRTIIYYTSKNTETKQRELRGVLCDGSSCNFQSFNEDELKNFQHTTIIKLASKYKESTRDKAHTLSNNKVELSRLYLKKTSEWFENAEIMVVIHFFANDQFIQEHTVFLPWALKKGYNENVDDIPFFTWPKEATKAIAVITEDDSDSAYFTVAREVSNIIKLFGDIGATLGGIADKVIDSVQKWVVGYDYIGTATFDRDSCTSTAIKADEGTAIFYLKE